MERSPILFIAHDVCPSIRFKAGTLIHVISDAHLYDRHIDLVKEVMEKPQHKAPKLKMDTSIKNFYDFTVDSFELEDYEFEKLGKKIPVAI